MNRPDGNARLIQRRSLLGLTLAVVLAGATHALLVSCGGGSQQQTSTEQPATGTATEPAPAPAETSGTMAAGPGDAAEGQKIYQLRCTPCHGAQGKGDGPLGKSLNPPPRDHTNGSYMNAQTDEQLLTVIRNGKGAMPPWGNTLSEADLMNVLAYVRSLSK
jgi:mono/diheme cytochrome c family protein